MRDDRIALALLLAPFLIIALSLGAERTARQIMARAPQFIAAAKPPGSTTGPPAPATQPARTAALNPVLAVIPETKSIAPPPVLPALALLIEPPPPVLPALALLMEPPPPVLPSLALLIEPPAPVLPGLALVMEPPAPVLPSLALLIEPPAPVLPGLALVMEPPPPVLPALALLIEPPPPVLPALALLMEPPAPVLPALALLIEPPAPVLPGLALLIEPPPPVLPSLALLIEPPAPVLPGLALLDGLRLASPVCHAGREVLQPGHVARPDIPPPVGAAEFGLALSRAARDQLGQLVVYNPKYLRIGYPMGDVPSLFGVCTDVVVRAYRALGIDLQALVQETRSGRGDRNIDHRRVEVVRRFLARHGVALPISDLAEDYQPGDIVTYYRPQNRVSTAHIAIVTDQIAPSGRPMIVHNRGWGPELEDALFVDKITGHYRFAGLTAASKREASPRDPRMRPVREATSARVALPLPSRQ